MTLQILDIVVYGLEGERRELPLKPGRLNIITGSSKAGKSALIDIVNYCFGSDKCEVPEGPIRRKSSWFGMRFQLASGQAFVARRCPRGAAQSSEDCFVIVGSDVVLPEFPDLRATTNTKGLVVLLSQWCGIAEHLHEPPPGQTRAPISASVRHALLLCLQTQDELIRKQHLFHSADDRFVANSIRDTLPYFLGAVDDQYVSKRAEQRRLREELRVVQRQLAELRSLSGEGTSRAATLLAEARDLGLTSATVTSWEETVSALGEVHRVPLSAINQATVDTVAGGEAVRLSAERKSLLDEQRRVREEIAAVQEIQRDENGYASELQEQQARLSSIGIFSNSVAVHTSCPLCTQELPIELRPPTVSGIERDLSTVSSQLDSVIGVVPHVERAVSELEARLRSIGSRLRTNRDSMDSVRSAHAELKSVVDDQARRAHLLGKIALYMQSLPELPDFSKLEASALQLAAAVEDLEEQLSAESVQERLASILRLIGARMTDWSKELKLEHSDASLTLDLKKLTIIADTLDGPVPMARIGSGENWVSYHLIAHLALHDWFVKKSRPVPRFLFLDQPSQVYFPAERDIDGTLSQGKEEDRIAVIRMFKLLKSVADALHPEMQIIVTEHADIAEQWYQEAVVHRWRGGVKLIPEDWKRE